MTLGRYTADVYDSLCSRHWTAPALLTTELPAVCMCIHPKLVRAYAFIHLGVARQHV